MGVFKNMGGNLLDGNFLGGNFLEGGIHQGGESLMGGNFLGGSFPDTTDSMHFLMITSKHKLVTQFKLDFVMVKAISKSYTLDCSCKWL